MSAMDFDFSDYVGTFTRHEPLPALVLPDPEPVPAQLWVGTRTRPAAHAMARPLNNWHGHLPSGAYKPFGGMWTSTVGAEDPWLWYVTNEYPDAFPADARMWVLDPMPARRLVIVTEQDVSDFHARYARPMPGISENITYSRLLRVVDWEQIRADGWDGVHLPRWWPQHIRFGLRYDSPITFYGWDCESTLWLRWRFWRARMLSAPEMVEMIALAQRRDE